MGIPSNVILPHVDAALSRTLSSEIGEKVTLNYLPP